MTNFFRTESSDPKINAQRNLAGRSHYVDDDSLRFHKSRINACRIVDNGLLLAIVESVAIDYRNTQRGFRYVVFDVFGHVISRVELDDCWRTSEQALKAMWAYLDTVDAPTHTLTAIENAERCHAEEMADMRKKVAQIDTKAAA